MTKDVRNLYRLKKITKNLLRQKKETKAIKDRMLRDIRNLSEYEEEESYYKPVRVSNFWSSNCIKYENNGNRNKALSVEQYLK